MPLRSAVLRQLLCAAAATWVSSAVAVEPPGAPATITVATDKGPV